MIIQVNTDDNIEGRDSLAAEVQSVIERNLERFAGQITRVEVHLGDVNSFKGGARDKRCLMEARLEGYPPVAVTNEAPTIRLAVDGATDKLWHRLDSALGRLRDR